MTEECVTLISGCEVEVIVASETCPVEVIEADSSTVEVIEVSGGGGGSSTPSILADTTIYVETTGDDVTGEGSLALPFATPNRALEYLDSVIILNGALVVISLGAGEFNITTPLECNNSLPEQISILGQSLTGTMPSAIHYIPTDGAYPGVGVSSKLLVSAKEAALTDAPTNLLVLENVFPTRIVIDGNNFAGDAAVTAVGKEFPFIDDVLFVNDGQNNAYIATCFFAELGKLNLGDVGVYGFQYQLEIEKDSNVTANRLALVAAYWETVYIVINSTLTTTTGLVIASGDWIGIFLEQYSTFNGSASIGGLPEDALKSERISSANIEGYIEVVGCAYGATLDDSNMATRSGAFYVVDCDYALYANYAQVIAPNAHFQNMSVYMIEAYASNVNLVSASYHVTGITDITIGNGTLMLVSSLPAYVTTNVEVDSIDSSGNQILDVNTTELTILDAVTKNTAPIVVDLGGSLSINTANGTSFKKTITAITALSFVFNKGEGQVITLYLLNGGAFATTFTGVTWLSGETPVLNASGKDVLEFHTDGSAIYGNHLGAGSGAGGVTDGNNVGTGGGEVFKVLTGTVLDFKTIKAGTGVIITNNAEDITIDATGAGGGETNTSSNSGTGEGLALAKNGVDLPFKSLTHDATIILVPTAEEIGIGVNEANVEHQNISGAGLANHAQIDSHLSDGTIHFTEGSIDHTAIANVGANSHAQLDAHLADALKHFLVGDINHAVIQNIGTNSHVAIDAHLASSANPHSVTLEQARSQNNVLAGDVDLGNNDLLNVLSLAFKDGQAVTWNPDDLTINIPTGIGPVIQAGQEMVQRFQNATGATITNGQMVYIIPGAMTNGYPHIALALADNHTTLITDQFMATMDIPNGSAGFCTKQGKVRGLDTSAYSTGAVLWLSTTVPGGYTNVPPEFPNYRISVGIVIASHATEGIISVVILNRFTDTLRNFHNGTFREKFVFAVTSDGVTITGTLSPKGTNADMTMLFSDGFSILDTTPHITLTITPGTSDTVNKVYIYVLQSNKTVIEGSSWPEVEHIRIAEVAVLDAASTQADGPVLNQNFNDAVQGTTGQGHLSHITERLRKEGAVWDSGTEGLITLVGASTPDDVFLSITGGVIFQLHKHTFLAMDQATGSKAHITNHPTTPYVGVTNLNTQLLDASGVSLNNTSFSFVAWGIINNDSDNDHVLINLPTSSYAYTAVSEAISDPNNYSVYAIPNEFIGVGFLIARFTFTYKNDAWTLEATEDLRGAKPNVSAGGGVGGSGVTTFLGLTDAPSAYAGQAGLYPQVNAGETALEFYDADADYLKLDGSNIMTDDLRVYKDTAGDIGAVVTNIIGGVRLNVDSAGNVTLFQADQTGAYAKRFIGFTRDGGALIYNNDSVIAAISAAGVTILGKATSFATEAGDAEDKLTTKGFIDSNFLNLDGSVAMTDSLKAEIVTSAGIYSVFINSLGASLVGTNSLGNLYIAQADANGNWEKNFITGESNAGVKINFNGSVKIEATNTGGAVTGDITASGVLPVGGSSLTRKDYVDLFAKKSLSNTFTKPQLMDAYVTLTDSVVTPDLDNYATFRISTIGSVTINEATFTGVLGRAVRSGIIRIDSSVTSITLSVKYRFGAGPTPPGGELGFITYTAMNADQVICTYTNY